MTTPPPHDDARRRFLHGLLALPAALAAAPLLGLPGCEAPPGTPAPASPASRASLTPTPACDDGDDPTPPQTAGPFFKPDSPERTSLLEAGLEGAVLVVTGQVLTRSCQPVAGALLDFWQADDGGNYDNAGFRLRGHQYADADGRFRLETIVPGQYPGRTRHIHVRVQAPDERVLTTQLYFPGERANERDGLFRAECLMTLGEGADGRQGHFDFILDLA
jgi:protocatechuate 3,4-dioxygenase beta subunit